MATSLFNMSDEFNDKQVEIQARLTYPDLITSANRSVTVEILSVSDPDGLFSEGYPCTVAVMATAKEVICQWDIIIMDPESKIVSPITKEPTIVIEWPIEADYNPTDCYISIANKIDPPDPFTTKVEAIPTKSVIKIPDDIDRETLIIPGSGVPEGWPLFCGIDPDIFGSGIMARLGSFNFSWIKCPDGVSISETMLLTSYIDANGNWQTGTDGFAYNGVAVPNPPTNDTRIKFSIQVFASNGTTAQEDLVTLTLPRYIPPKLVSFDVDRCDENGELDEEGGYLDCKINLELWTPEGVDPIYANSLDSLSTFQVIDPSISTTLDPSANIVATKSGVINNATSIVGDGLINANKAYKVVAKIRDLTLYPGNEYSETIEDVYCTVDFLDGGKGIAFGTTATKEGFECDMESYFDKPVHVIDDKLSVEKSVLASITTSGNEYLDIPMFEVDPATGIVSINQVLGAYSGENNLPYPISNPFWAFDSQNRKVYCRGRLALTDLDGAKEGFVWNGGNYLAYLKTQILVDVPTGGNYIKSRNRAPLRSIVAPNTDSFAPIISSKSLNGEWAIGTNGDRFEIIYTTDAKYQAGTNEAFRIDFIDPGGSFDAQLRRARSMRINGEELWKIFFPIGFVWISYVNTSPASLFGGSWTQITGKVLRADNNVTASGSDTHSHTAGSLGAKLSVETDGYIYYRYKGATAWTPNYWAQVTRVGNSGISKTPTSGIELAGSTDSASNLPAYQNLYVWRRTA